MLNFVTSLVKIYVLIYNVNSLEFQFEKIHVSKYLKEK